MTLSISAKQLSNHEIVTILTKRAAKWQKFWLSREDFIALLVMF